MHFLTSTVCHQINDFSFIILQKTFDYFLFIQSQYILVVKQFSNKKRGVGGNKKL